jgi:hypothetical protein
MAGMDSEWWNKPWPLGLLLGGLLMLLLAGIGTLTGFGIWQRKQGISRHGAGYLLDIARRGILGRCFSDFVLGLRDATLIALG